MKYTVEKFFGEDDLLKAAAKTTAKGAPDFAGLTDNAAKGVVKNVNLADGAKALNKAPTTKVKRATDVGQDVGGAVGKGDDVLDGGVVDNIIQEGVNLTDEVGAAARLTNKTNGLTDEVTGLGTKNADEAADKLTDAAKTNKKLSSKIAKVLKENPGKT